MRSDPKGYYAQLEVDPDASRETIAAAYRRKARVLHPDVPGTGNAAAFVAMKQAYEVLANPLERAAYDRSAQARPEAFPPDSDLYDDGEEIFAEPPPPPPMRSARFRHPRLSDVPIGIWIALGGLVLIAGLEAVVHLSAAPDLSRIVEVPATAPSVTPEAPPTPTAPVPLAGTPNAYVMPAADAAVVWRRDPQQRDLVPLGEVPAFTAVQVIQVLPQRGLVEVRLGHQRDGFIDASRLIPGDAAAAHRAYCAYNAGTEPDNGEMLQRDGVGPVAVTLVNRSGQPAVVKLRTPQGISAATVYLAPNGESRVTGLPAVPYRPDFAIGELWSRACGSFAAGMRSQRFSAFIDFAALSRLYIPPDLSPLPPPVDISDQEFERH